MKNKNVLKLLLSLSLGIVFVLMMNIKTTGLLFHEIFGIIIFIGIIIHNILNWNWTKGISKNILKNKVTLRAKIMYLLVILLCLSLSTITITGILMSKYILPSITTSNILLIKFLHKYSSYLAVGLVSIHFLLHTNYLLMSLKKLFINISDKNVRVALSQFSIVIVLIVILYFPLTSYLNSNDNLYNDTDIVFEEALDEIPSENIELIDNNIIKNEHDIDADSSSENEDIIASGDTTTEINNNDLYHSENIQNTESNTTNEQNVSQNNIIVQEPTENNNSITNNTNTNNSGNNNTIQGSDIETPPVVTPPVVTPPTSTHPVEEDNKEDDTTIDSGNNLEAELAAYLKRLGCHGCERGCMLDNPFCMVGIEKAEKAKDKFLQFHTYNSSNDEFIV